MGTVRLKNGAEAVEELVDATMLYLERIRQTDPVALYHLVQKCHDKSYELCGNTVSVLQGIAMIQDERGGIHDSIRDIILSAVQGEGFNMSLSSPVEKK